MTVSRERYEQLFEVIKGRRSVRSFDTTPVSGDDLTAVLEAARWAPSPGNRQPWRFIISSDRCLSEMEEAVRSAVAKIREAALEKGLPGEADYLENFLVFTRSPTVVAVIMREPVDLIEAITDGGSPIEADQPLVDAAASAGAAIQNMLLACHALGLGACWTTGPLVARLELEKILDVPRGWRLAALVAVGYPLGEETEEPSRRPLDKLLLEPKGKK